MPSRTRVGATQTGYQQIPSFGSVNAPTYAGSSGQIPTYPNTNLFPSSPPIITATPPPQSILPGTSQPGVLGAPNFDGFNSPAPQFPLDGNQPNFNSLPTYPSGNSTIFPNNQSSGWPPVWNQPAWADAQNNNGWPNSPQGWPSEAWSRWRNDYLPKLFQHLRWRQTWLEGGSGPDVDILETELSTSLTLPNFFGSSKPLRLSPVFIFHFWDGPDTAVTGFDLPSQAYSAFLSSDFVSDARNMAGVETTMAVGVYTDFQNVSSDSLLVTGVGLGWVRVNPYTTMKLGIEYLDRIDVKLLPAFGFFMQPTNDMKINLYFPRPKLAHRFPRIGNYDVWGYAGAEYGGGTWTIERLGGLDDQVDINDVRAFFGYEWMGPRGVTGFIEGGYVFEREMLYRSAPAAELHIPDTVMLRAGIAF